MSALGSSLHKSGEQPQAIILLPFISELSSNGNLLKMTLPCVSKAELWLVTTLWKVGFSASCMHAST